jgi:CheY-like chemotaxis protein
VPGASIFLVEDEGLIRLMLADMVEELGHRVVAEEGNLEVGQALAETAIFDLAIPIRLPTGELTSYIGKTEAKLPKEFHLSNVVTFPKKTA